MTGAYRQITLDAKSREKSTFITLIGLYQYERTPKRLCNSSATFQRIADFVLAGPKRKTCSNYIKDILNMRKTNDETLNRLKKARDRL